MLQKIFLHSFGVHSNSFGEQQSRRRKGTTMGRRRRNKIPTAATASSAWRWIDLPGDVTANILQRLGSEEILRSAQKVCTTWEKVCRDPSMWRVVDLKNRCVDDLEFDLMCRCAVDRSQGQLTDLSITYFGDDDLLRYVVVRYVLFAILAS